MMESGITVGGDDLVGRVCRVTAAITPGHLGEVMIAVRGGSEAFHAYAGEPDETIARGARVVVIEYYPPRTVVVSRV
jgi:hypothetical protein